jgi:hypothetical protein
LTEEVSAKTSQRSRTDHAKQIWPNMNVGAGVVTGNATARYNCLAWTLGVTTSWLWPWGSKVPTKGDFDTFYQGFGFVPSGAGPIAAFGLNPNGMTHGAVCGPGHGPRWESKCGAWLRLQHGLAEMEGGALYGDVLGFYSRIGGSELDDKVERLTTMTAKLSRSDLRFLKDRVKNVEPELKRRFAHAYTAWKESWDHPLIAVSSDPATRTQTPAFLELIALGPQIIPLLMEKLTNPNEFFTLQAVDRLSRPEFVISDHPDDPALLLGEQARAIETVRHWIRTHV